MPCNIHHSNDFIGNGVISAPESDDEEFSNDEAVSPVISGYTQLQDSPNIGLLHICCHPLIPIPITFFQKVGKGVSKIFIFKLTQSFVEKLQNIFPKITRFRNFLGCLIRTKSEGNNNIVQMMYLFQNKRPFWFLLEDRGLDRKTVKTSVYTDIDLEII